MKKQSKTRSKDIELYKYLDHICDYRRSEYYGIFGYELDADYAIRNSYKKLNIDVKRYQKILGPLKPEMLAVINKRQTHYFTPKKAHYNDYNCNILNDGLEEIYREWFRLYMPLIEEQVAKIEKPQPKAVGDYTNFQCGISSAAAAQAWANWVNNMNELKYVESCRKLIAHFYGQFFHMTCAKIEALFVKVLTKNNAIREKFDRNVLYATAAGKEKGVDKLEHFKYYDKLYSIWNFIKHNTNSTYETLKGKYPETLISKRYSQGQLAVYWLKFSPEFIRELIEGVTQFTNEYCKLVFNEDSYEACWNYDDYFLQPMLSYYESMVNPLGLDWWDDID